MRFFSLFFIILAWSSFAIPAFGAEAAPVVVSIAPQKYLVDAIAGDLAIVTVLVSPGADPHSFEPSPSQVRACAKARVYFTIGLPFEAVWGPRIAGVAPGLRMVSLVQGITRLDTEAEKAPAKGKNKTKHDHEGEDPHVWLSPALLQRMVPIIEAELTQLMPEQAALLHTNATALTAQLQELQGLLAAKFASVPSHKRVFLSFHPAWNYFAQEYGLTAYALEVHGKEPGPRQMQAIIDKATSHGIQTLFIEPQFPKAAAQAVAKNIGAGIVTADPLAYDVPANLRNVADSLAASFTHTK